MAFAFKAAGFDLLMSKWRTSSTVALSQISSASKPAEAFPKAMFLAPVKAGPNLFSCTKRMPAQNPNAFSLVPTPLHLASVTAAKCSPESRSSSPVRTTGHSSSKTKAKNSKPESQWSRSKTTRNSFRILAPDAWFIPSYRRLAWRRSCEL